ncbi:NHLP leader peptide family RiPP precursor [Thermodesulfobacteriota bacterium]
MAEQNEQAKQWAKVVAKAWADEDYKQRLMADPVSLLAEEGIEVPEGVQLKVVEATDKQAWMVLPPKPETGKIEEGKERLAAGGGWYFTWAGACG